MTFAAGALLGGLAGGFQGSSPPATTALAASVPDVAPSTAAPDSPSTSAATAEAGPTSLQELLEDPPFQPPTYNDGTERVVPLVFPDGSSVELIHGASLALHTRGVLATTSGVYADGPTRAVTLLPAGPGTIEWPSAPVAAAPDTGADVVLVTDVARDRSWLAIGFRHGTLLVDNPRSAPMTDAELTGWYESLSAVRHPSGFVSLRAQPPLELAVPGVAAGPEVIFGGESPEHAALRLAPCPAEDSAGVLVCFPGLPVHFEVSGNDEFVAEVAGTVRARNYAPTTPVVAPIVTGPNAIGGLALADLVVTPTGSLVGYGWNPAIDSHGAMFRSTDHGATWDLQQAPAPEGIVRSLAIAADGRLLVGMINWDGAVARPAMSVWASADDGATWTSIFAESQDVAPGVAADVQALAAPSGEIVLADRACVGAGCSLTVRVSDDGGVSFPEEWFLRSPDAEYTDLYATLSFQGEKLVAPTQACREVAADEGGYLCASHVLVSEDLGASWSEFSVPPEYQLSGDLSNAVVVDDGVLAAGEACGVDETCTALLLSGDEPGPLARVSAIPMSEVSHLWRTPAGALLAVGGGVARSDDGGAAWVSAQVPLDPATGWFSSLAAAPGGSLYLAGWGDESEAVLWRSDDDGRTWVDVLGEGAWEVTVG